MGDGVSLKAQRAHAQRRRNRGVLHDLGADNRRRGEKEGILSEKYAVKTGYVIANYKEYPPEEIKGYVGPDGFVKSKIEDAKIFPGMEEAQRTRIARWGGSPKFRVEMRQRRVKLPPVKRKAKKQFMIVAYGIFNGQEVLEGYIGRDGHVIESACEAKAKKFSDFAEAERYRLNRWGGAKGFRIIEFREPVEWGPPPPPPEPDYLEVVRMAKEAVRALRSP